MFKGKRVLFYVPGLDVLNGAVYYSQVFGLAQYLVSKGADCLVFESAYDDQSVHELTVNGVRIVSAPQSMRYVPYPLLQYKNRATARPVLDRLMAFSPTHVYVRNMIAGLSAFDVVRGTGAKLVFSRRGDERAETVAGGRWKDRVKSWLARYYTIRVMRKASHVSMVSSELMTDTERFCSSCSVLPCCVMDDKFVKVSELERRKCREELSIPIDAKVMVYSGSLAAYQCVPEFLSLMRAVHEADSSIYFMLLCEWPDKLKTDVERVGLPDTCYRMRKCTPQEVSAYLQSADVGVILRRNDAINRSASPVKIAEYLASGLGVVASPWIGDAGNWLKSEKCALLYDGRNPIADVVAYVNGISSEMRTASRNCAMRYYTYAGNEATIQKMFA